MKTTYVVLIFLSSLLICGAEDRLVAPSGKAVAAKSTALKELKRSPEWLALQDNLDVLTNKLAAYDVSHAAATNAIVATTGTTKTALNKVLNVVEDDHAVDIAVKKCLIDMKKVLVVEADAQ